MTATRTHFAPVISRTRVQASSYLPGPIILMEPVDELTSVLNALVEHP
jgi:hypothetical protein